MKYYQAEMEAHDFMKGWHSLKEWASWGFNKVIYKDRSYWDGLENGFNSITEDVQDLEMDYYDYDEDGFMYVVLREGAR